MDAPPTVVAAKAPTTVTARAANRITRANGTIPLPSSQGGHYRDAIRLFQALFVLRVVVPVEVLEIGIAASCSGKPFFWYNNRAVRGKARDFVEESRGTRKANSMDATSENREFTRSDTGNRCEIRMASEPVIEGQVYDVSMNGVRVHCGKRLPVGATCDVTLLLDGGNDRIRIPVQGRVVRADDAGAAIAFTTVDRDGLEHLRNLILYNSTDTEKTEGEFHRHIGMKPR
jgi:hypothetical protein